MKPKLTLGLYCLIVHSAVFQHLTWDRVAILFSPHFFYYLFTNMFPVRGFTTFVIKCSIQCFCCLWTTRCFWLTLSCLSVFYQYHISGNNVKSWSCWYMILSVCYRTFESFESPETVKPRGEVTTKVTWKDRSCAANSQQQISSLVSSYYLTLYY